MINMNNPYLVIGLRRNSQKSRLIDPLFDWAVLASNEELLGLLYQLIKTATTEDCFKLEQKTALILRLKNQSHNLFKGLQKICLVRPIFMKDLLTELYAAHKEELAALSELCSIAQLENFKNLVNYVFEAKKQKVPLNILVSQAPNETPLDEWLRYPLETLEAYATQAISYKILREGIYRQEDDFFARSSAFNEFIENTFATAHPKAINLLIASYAPVFEEGQLSSQSLVSVQLLNNLFQHTPLATINTSVCQMAAEVINPLLTHCLLGLNSQDLSYKEASRHLLFLLCQSHSAVPTQSLELIKTRLSQPDLFLLKDKKLIDLAKAVLRPESIDRRNIVWIQDLLLSPEFIAAASAHSFQLLAELYRLILMTLKQAEFELYHNELNKKMAFSSHHHRCITRVERALAKEPNKPQLLTTRNQLLNFRAEDCIWGLFKQLEEICVEKRKTEPLLADKALAVLYSYYENSLTSLRSDLLFKIAHFIIRTLPPELEIFSATEPELLNLKAPKKNAIIYNSAGEKIGFVTEANYAMTFIEDLPLPLLDLPNIAAGMNLYDKERVLTGNLTANGEIKPYSPRQESFFALLLAKMPRAYLEQSFAALGLFINNLFSENALAKLYENSDVNKQEWLSEQVNARLIRLNKLVQKENFEAAVKYQSSKTLFTLLANIGLTANAEQLFTAILADTNKREELFSEAQQEAVFIFLGKHDVSSLMANFLIRQQAHSWLKDGLLLFVNFSQKTNQPDLIFRALDLLRDRVNTQKNLPKEQLDSLLTTLLNSEACATIIWRFVLKANSLDSLQQVNPEYAKRLASFFFKQQCMTAITTLNKQNNWILSSYQYRLVLLILAKQCAQLFRATTEKLAERVVWSSEELKQMTLFIKKHFVQRANPDKNFALGREILEELLFKSANLGQIDLFYREGEFDPDISILKLETGRSNILARNEGKNLPPAIKMSLISAFLIHYSGSQQLLVQLINDYLHSKRVLAKSEYLHSISLVMAQLPHRDFSVCVFNKLEELITHNPASFDRKLLADMSKFYTFRANKNHSQGLNAELQLLSHFGQHKKYELIVQSCDLLESEVADSERSSLLREIARLAKMESKLSRHLSRWYYPIYRFLLRFKNYDPTKQDPAALYVPPCNEKSHYSSPIKTPVTIRAPSLEVEKAKNSPILLKTRYQGYFENLATSLQAFSLAKSPSFFNTPPSFNNKGSATEKEQQNDVRITPS